MSSLRGTKQPEFCNSSISKQQILLQYCSSLLFKTQIASFLAKTFAVIVNQHFFSL